MEKKTEWIVLYEYNELSSLLDDLNVPELRKDLTKTANIHWLNRNLAINNEGPTLERAKALVKTILKGVRK